MRRAHGSQKAAAIVIATDPGNLSRDVRAGRLSLSALERLGDDVLREFGALLVEEYGAVDPRERARRLLPQLVDEFLRLVE